jgi:hypothetical protein
MYRHRQLKLRMEENLVFEGHYKFALCNLQENEIYKY